MAPDSAIPDWEDQVPHKEADAGLAAGRYSRMCSHKLYHGLEQWNCPTVCQDSERVISLYNLSKLFPFKVNIKSVRPPLKIASFVLLRLVVVTLHWKVHVRR